MSVSPCSMPDTSNSRTCELFTQAKDKQPIPINNENVLSSLALADARGEIRLSHAVFHYNHKERTHIVQFQYVDRKELTDTFQIDTQIKFENGKYSCVVNVDKVFHLKVREFRMRDATSNFTIPVSENEPGDKVLADWGVWLGPEQAQERDSALKNFLSYLDARV